MTQAALFDTDSINPGRVATCNIGPEGARCGDCHHCIGVRYARAGGDIDHYACELVADGFLKARSPKRRLKDRACALWRWRQGELRVWVRGNY